MEVTRHKILTIEYNRPTQSYKMPRSAGSNRIYCTHVDRYVIARGMLSSVYCARLLMRWAICGRRENCLSLDAEYTSLRPFLEKVSFGETFKGKCSPQCGAIFFSFRSEKQGRIIRGVCWGMRDTTCHTP